MFVLRAGRNYNVDFNPTWVRGAGDRPVREQHAQISNEPFMNVLAIGKKKVGKTTVCVKLIMDHLMTKQTKLVIFSADIEEDEKAMQAINLMRKKYDNKRDGFEHIVIYNKIMNGETNNFLEELEEAKEEFLEENDSKYEYPRTIFYIDDMDNKFLRSEKLGHTAQNIRHLGSTFIYSTQSYTNLEPRIRTNADILMLWPNLSKKRLKLIYDEIQPGIAEDAFISMYEQVTNSTDPENGRKNFLYINITDAQFRVSGKQEVFTKYIL